MARGAEVKRIILRGLRRRVLGQSLVEFAVALPILLFIIAGIVEVGNIFIQRNRAALVARETARFVATGGDDTSALVISEQTVEQAFGGQVIAFDEEHLNIYIIHATIGAADGTQFIDDGDLDNCSSEDDFCETHIYPTQQYYDDNFGGVDQAPHSGWTPEQIFDRLSQEVDITYTSPDDDDLKYVAVVVQYNTTTIIDLPIFPQTNGGIPLNELTIMKQEATIAEAAGTPTQGCSAYPIAVSADAFAGASQKDVRTLTYGTTGPLQYNYLLWNDDNLAGGEGARLEASLGGDQVPLSERGDSNPFPHPPPVSNTKDPDFGYIDPGDPTDTALHKGDPVLRNSDPGGANAMSMMTDHINDKRVIRILEFDSFDGTHFNISGVIIVKIVSLTGINGTMEVEYVRHDSSCGN